ncbi:MAG: sigma-54 dependent transcriptional regulator [Desulfobacterales bacterium]|nr:sigma-54 dependent transcriptional regulator [Desulfobacterales bacterium]
MAHVIIIDDDPGMNRMLTDLISSIGHRATGAHTLAQGLELVQSTPCDVVFLDVMMPDGSGLDIIQDIRTQEPPPEVIIMTGVGDPDGAETAIRAGAWDYLQKPLSPKKIILPLKRVLQYRDTLKQKNPTPTRLDRDDIKGSGPGITACLEQLARATQSRSGVLITGETGTGKEVFARCLHRNSGQAQGRLVVVDCAALAENLVESTLFGHVKGAFTGAITDRGGLVAQAHQGTLFLDEVGELDLRTQKIFLRVLQEQRFRPVGGKREIQSQFRLVAATHRDLDRMVARGQFRKDLLFRLRTLEIQLPPLRKRQEDIPELATHFMDMSCTHAGLKPKGFSPEFMDLITAHDWPGNVRELAAVMESAVTSGLTSPLLFSSHLPQDLRIQVARGRVDRPAPLAMGAQDPAPQGLPRFKEFRTRALDQVEQEYIQCLLDQTRGDMARACQVSGMGRTRLYELMKKHGITRN